MYLASRDLKKTLPGSQKNALGPFLDVSRALPRPSGVSTPIVRIALGWPKTSPGASGTPRDAPSTPPGPPGAPLRISTCMRISDLLSTTGVGTLRGPPGELRAPLWDPLFKKKRRKRKSRTPIFNALQTHLLSHHVQGPAAARVILNTKTS